MEESIIRHVNDVPAIDCACGKSTRIITRKDTAKLNLHRTVITDSKRHYHKETTEVYYILKGEGRMELDEKEIDLRPGQCIYIPPGMRHKVTGNIETLIVGVPAFDDSDEYFD